MFKKGKKNLILMSPMYRVKTILLKTIKPKLIKKESRDVTIL